MILTGDEIASEVRAGRIQIEEFDVQRIEPNSYGFRLAPGILWYEQDVLDSFEPPRVGRLEMGQSGTVLEPDRLYLGSTMEALGSAHYAATLYARRSVSTLGVWIQLSAPLGHSGAIFPWTLEIKVAQPVRVFPGMVIGKIAFWAMQGESTQYSGKYRGSPAAVASRLSTEYRPAPHEPNLVIAPESQSGRDLAHESLLEERGAR